MKRTQLYLFTFLIAFCSLSYEFILIKLMGLLQGGRIEHYNLVVSLFTFFLGIGALASSKINLTTQNLRRVEFTLATLGFLSPFILLYFQFMLLAMILVSLIGFFSGFEIPMLMNIQQEDEARILAFDYFGMFASSLLIPLLLFKQVGILPAAFAVALLNLLLALHLTATITPSKKAFATLSCALLISIIFFNHQRLNNYFSQWFLERSLQL